MVRSGSPIVPVWAVTRLVLVSTTKPAGIDPRLFHGHAEPQTCVVTGFYGTEPGGPLLNVGMSKSGPRVRGNSMSTATVDGRE